MELSDMGAQAQTLAHGASNGGSAVQLAMLLALVSLAPALVLSCTTFSRFVVVFFFLRNGLGTHSAPPNQVLVGLSLFMTMFVMGPVAGQIYDDALKPYLDKQLNEEQALARATPPLRGFLLARTRGEDLAMFYQASGQGFPRRAEDVPLRIAIPSFVVSEITVAFRIGLTILLPFLVIDLVVAAVLTALGMVMLPPPIISLPVKLLLFVSIDGWNLLVSSLLKGAS